MTTPHDSDDATQEYVLKGLTIVRHSVKRASKRVFNAATVSSVPSSPFSRFRLNRMYQFVSSSMRSSNLGMMV